MFSRSSIGSQNFNHARMVLISLDVKLKELDGKLRLANLKKVYPKNCTVLHQLSTVAQHRFLQRAKKIRQSINAQFT
jgi:hypothetical protein